MRINEVAGKAGRHIIKLALDIQKAYHCDLIERKHVPYTYAILTEQAIL